VGTENIVQLRNHLWFLKISPVIFVIVLGCSDGSRFSDSSRFDVCHIVSAEKPEVIVSGSTSDNDSDVCYSEDVGIIIPGADGPRRTRCTLWSDIDLSMYEVIPSLEDETLHWENVQPAKATDYWELRSYYNGVIAKVGNKCQTATNQEACMVAFDTLNGTGFKPLYFQVRDRRFVVSNHGDTNCVWDTLEKLKVFLGTINSKEEAILLAVGHVFGAGEKKEEGAIREVDGEYELIVLKGVRNCNPIQTNRYLIRIQPSGELRVLREQIYEQLTNTCA